MIRRLAPRESTEAVIPAMPAPLTASLMSDMPMPPTEITVPPMSRDAPEAACHVVTAVTAFPAPDDR